MSNEEWALVKSLVKGQQAQTQALSSLANLVVVLAKQIVILQQEQLSR